MLARSKLNSIETKISQALIDLEISQEKHKTIINEVENYKRLKKIKMMKSDDDKEELSDSNKNIIEKNENEQGLFEHIWKWILFLLLKKHLKKWCTKWLHKSHKEEKLEHWNLPVITWKYPWKYRKQRQEFKLQKYSALQNDFTWKTSDKSNNWL